MKKYKVLRKEGGKLFGPFKDFEYKIGKGYICEDFDETDTKCSRGFYATDEIGLLYCYNKDINNAVFEVEVSGKQKIFDEFKQRFEKQMIIREITEKELKEIVKKKSDKLEWNLYEALFPINPLKIKREKKVTEKEIESLKEWASVGDLVGDLIWDSVGGSVGDLIWDSVGDSIWDSVGGSVGDLVWDSVGGSIWDSVGGSVGDLVWASVWDSVEASVRDLVGASVRDSVWDSVWSYISSLFPNIEKWKYVEHEINTNPFQSGVDLWKAGLVPSFHNKIWRLHCGENAEIVCEMKV